MSQEKISPARRDCLRHIAGAMAAPLLGAGSLAAPLRGAEAGTFCKGIPLLRGEHGFRYFDELLYMEKPDLIAQGLTPIHVAYTWQIWGERKFDGVIENQVPYDSIATYPKRLNFDKSYPETVVVNIEHWATDRVPKERAIENVERYRQAFVAFRQALKPGTRLTYYNFGALPGYFYWVEARSYREYDYARWRKQNDVLQPVLECFDFFCPSLYLRKTMSLEQWKRRATDFIAEHRRLAGDDRMVVPFIWPHYAALRPFETIPGDVWGEMLALIRDQADSVVLWRGVGGPRAATWDEDAEWWQVTKDFLARER